MNGVSQIIIDRWYELDRCTVLQLETASMKIICKAPSYSLNPLNYNIMIFDDVMMNDQTAIKQYFCSGRHNNVNVFYLVQSLHK